LLVLAMEDVTERRRSEADLKAIETYAQNIVDTVREPLLILDGTLRVRSGNRAFYQTFQVSLEETENRLIYELGNGQWDIPACARCSRTSFRRARSLTISSSSTTSPLSAAA
jgi:PAS domain-containing protein